ncbi:MAG TPA: DNA-binding response regulator, partial [Pseudomonas sp.]|nr:DNA-binding response regulator [Pseudomonas sp.]
PRQILAIEDDPILGAHLKTSLEERGFRVTLAEQGPSGLALAAGAEFDLILRRVAYERAPAANQSDDRLLYDDQRNDVRYEQRWLGLTATEYRL